MRSRVSIDSAAAAIASDAPTLARWGYLLYGGSIVSDESLALMTGFDPRPGQPPYGMGSLEHGAPGEGGIGHDGVSLGYQATLFTRPDSGVVAVALTNDDRLRYQDLPDLLARVAERECAAP